MDGRMLGNTITVRLSLFGVVVDELIMKVEA